MGKAYSMHRGREEHAEFTGKPEENRTFGTHCNRWKENIKMRFKEIVWVGVDGFGSG
jgi:hypothetical protein